MWVWELFLIKQILQKIADNCAKNSCNLSFLFLFFLKGTYLIVDIAEIKLKKG